MCTISPRAISVSSRRKRVLPQPRRTAPNRSSATVWKDRKAGRPTRSGSYVRANDESGVRRALKTSVSTTMGPRFAVVN